MLLVKLEMIDTKYTYMVKFFNELQRLLVLLSDIGLTPSKKKFNHVF